jgi:hypothetical protein
MTITKKGIDFINNWKFHKTQKKSALNTLKSIESVKGKTNSKLIKQSDEYAKEILGWKGYAPWLYAYSALNGEFKEGWIPDNYYGAIVIPKLKGKYGKISGYKSLTKILFNSNLFPDLFYSVNSLWLSNDYTAVPENKVRETLNSSAGKYVFKADNTGQGKGIHILDKNTIDLDKIKEYGNGVIQTFIRQHPFFDRIMPNSVATIRLTTLVDNKGDASLRDAYLRVGRSSDDYVKSSSLLKIPINIDDGSLEDYCYTPAWLQLEKHPDTGFTFKNKTIPSFRKSVKTVLSLQKKAPFCRIIGWDVTIDEDNSVQIMEWNGYHNAIKFSEAVRGPLFRDLEFEKLWMR